MKLWQKGAIAGFVLGFIYWFYVLLSIWNNPHYQFTKYSVASYSFFYGVVLVGVLLGVLIHIWGNVEERRIAMVGSIWGLYSVMGFIPPCFGSMGGCPEPEYSILHNLFFSLHGFRGNFLKSYHIIQEVY